MLEPNGLQLCLKETPTQIFSCEISKIFKNNFFTEHLRWLLLEGVAKACNFIKKETLAQVSSYEFCKISKNTYCYKTFLVAAYYVFS